MGKRGPQPKAAVLKTLAGNPGKREIIVPSVVPFGAPFIPEHLSEDAQACVELIKGSMPSAVYARLDGFALADFGTWWAWHKAAVHEMNSPDFEPIVVNSRSGGEQPSAWFKILNMASQNMRAIGTRLGLDPAARLSLHVPDDNRPVSKFDGLIGRAGKSLNFGVKEAGRIGASNTNRP